MKKILSALAVLCASGFVGLFSTSCVEENQTVLLHGFVLLDEGGKCSISGGSDQTYLGELTVLTTAMKCEESLEIKKNEEGKETEEKVYTWSCESIPPIISDWMLLRNYNISEMPWSSSGGSSGGSTLDYDIPNMNMVFLDEVVAKCVDVDGEKEGCNGVEDHKDSVNFPMQAGSGVCLSPYLDVSDVFTDGSYMTMDFYVKYHDTGKFKGKTSTSRVRIDFVDNAELCQSKANKNTKNKVQCSNQ